MRAGALAFLLVACSGATPAPAPHATAEVVRYLALGDSFTAGTGSSPAESFPARLAERLRAAGHDVVLRNVAVNGYTSGDVRLRELSALDDLVPTFVTLAVGANDIVRGVPPETFRENVHAIVAAVVARMPPAGLVGLPQPEWPRSPTGARFDATLETVHAYDAILRAEIESAGGRWAALESQMTDQADHQRWSPDGLHPDAGAYEAWADALLELTPP